MQRPARFAVVFVAICCLSAAACSSQSQQSTTTGTPGSAVSSAPAGSDVDRPVARTTALAVHSPTPVRFVLANDGLIHLELDLVVTNNFTADATLTSLVVLDDQGAELLRLEGDALRGQTFLLLSNDPTVTVPASASVFTVVDIPLATGNTDDVPAAVRNVLTYEIPNDAPLRILIGSTTVEGPIVAVDGSEPVVISPPLRGAGWWNANGCCEPTAHRTALLPAEGVFRVFEMFAIDWGRLIDGSDHTGSGDVLTDYYAYGQQVHSVADGKVIGTRNDMPEAPINTSQGGNETVTGAADLAGNHVVVEIAPDRYAVYGHLQPGSVAVQPGDMVAAGDILGLLGNTGNSTSPHLHFSIQDAPDALAANSVPFLINDYQVTGRAVISGPDFPPVVPDPSIQQNTFPLVYTITDFG